MNLVRSPLVLFEADERERRHQRQAFTGDPDAAAAYRREIQRRGGSDEHLKGFEHAWRSTNSKEHRDAYKRELATFERPIPRELANAHVPKVSRENVPGFGHGHVFHHHTLVGSDKEPVRARVTGRVKTWTTRPDDFRIPVKHGLRDSFYITPENAHEWMIGHPDEHPESDA